ncbi:MAG: aminoacyl-tRNA hydrolase [Prevotella sp.]|nr:aminoacyl-tRNA hydrolase [Prevotella sp.]
MRETHKFLITGIGNPGDEYHSTRHNIGWMVLDAFAAQAGITFDDKRYGFIAETSLKGKRVFLLKPTTYVNLSGNAVRYWLNKENIDTSRLLVVVDDIALETGKRRLRANGSPGGHNGLKHISQLIGDDYARLRIGIGNDFEPGGQINWVLGKFSEEERTRLAPEIEIAVEEIKSFVLEGVDRTMNNFNRR